MNPISSCCPAMRTQRHSIVALIAALFWIISLLSTAHAGMIVGTGAGSDHEADVIAVINTYNAGNDPDLPTDIDLFKKSDDDSAFVFNMANGFMFFSDAGGTMPILTEAALTATDEAYFKYTGPESLLYYSVKGGPNFNLYTFMAGLNLLQAPGANPPDISHVSFWSGHVPEPSSLILAAFGSTLLVLRRRR